MTNFDGTVTLKTTGKLAVTPTGSGTAAVRPAAYKSNPGGGSAPYVRKQPGRVATPRSAAAH